MSNKRTANQVLQSRRPPLRVVVFRMNGTMHLEILTNLIKRGLAEVIYWGGSKEGFRQAQKRKDLFPKTIFHDSFDAVQGFPAPGVPHNTFEPLGADIINRFGAAESQILTMMASVEPVPISLLKKKHIYFKYLKYWLGVFRYYKPDAIFFGDVPHLTYQHLAYRVAKELGIKTIMHRAVQVKGRIMFMDDIEDYRQLKVVYAEQLRHPVSPDDLSADVREYYLDQTTATNDKKVFYMKDDYIKQIGKNAYALPSISKLFLHFKNFTLFRTALNYIGMLIRRKSITGIVPLSVPGFILGFYIRAWRIIRDRYAKEYKSLMKQANLGEKFVYVPLQNQPEGNTSAMGDIFVDQALMIDLLSAALPPDWKIYVKESPLQWSAFRAHRGRYPGYYRNLASKPNVVLIDTCISTLELIDKAQAVATVTGTAGWEAILRGKPALVFGYIWYMYSDGVFRVSDQKGVEAAFSEIQKGFKPNPARVLQFLKAVDSVSIPAFQNTRFKKGNKLAISLEENIANITNGFITELTKLRAG